MVVKRLRGYFPFIINEFKSALVYKTSFFVHLSSKFLSILVTYYLWKAVYASSLDEVIGGFRIEEMTTFVIISFFTNTMISCVSIMDIAGDVYKGDIAINLIKPIDYQSICLAKATGKLVVNTIIYVFPFCIIFTVIGFLPVPSVTNIVLYALSVILGFIISYFFSFCFAIIAFHTVYFFGINLAKDSLTSLLSGGLIPLTFFSPCFKKALSILPFSSMLYYQIAIYLGKFTFIETLKVLFLQIIWAVVFFFLGRLCWSKAIRRIEIVGG